MTRVLLIVFVVLMVPTGVVAEGAWHKRRVAVRDYLPAERKADLADMVQAFNAVMPKRGPKLVYVAMPEMPCSAARAKGAIAVCEDAAAVRAETTQAHRGHRIMNAKIVLPTGRPGPLCEELMHALTDMTESRYDALSCEENVFYPTAFDVHYWKKVYKKYGRNR